MSEPIEQDATGAAREPAAGPESEAYRLHAGGAPGLLVETLGELRREHPGAVLAIAGASALVIVAVCVALARR